MSSSAPPANVTVVESGPTFEIWRGPQGSMRLDWGRTEAVRIVCSGYGHAEFVAPILRRLEQAVRTSGSFLQVCDWWDLQTYASPFRVQHGDWINEHKNVWAGAHVLQRSKLVQMGISVANLALGGKIKTYGARAEFEVVARRLGFATAPALVK